MENTKKKYSSQTILDKIENLMGEDSFVLALLKDQKLSAIDLKDKNEEKIKSKNLKIDELKKLVNDLQNEANKINDIFKMYKTADFKTLIDVLGLNIHFDEDAKVVEEKLPEIVQEKEKKIEELSKDVSTLETDVNSLVSRVTDIDKEYKDAKSFQSELIKLVKDSVDGKLNKTRDEVIKVLKDASFEEDEAIEAAKLILFPEDELIPFFAENKVLEEVQKSIDNITIDLDSDEESTDTDSSSDIAPSILPEEEKYLPYIIRGIIDGDGCISLTSYDSPQFYIVSASEDFIDWVKYVLENKLYMKDIHKKIDNRGLYKVETADKENLIKLKVLCYDKPFGMERKYKFLTETFRDYNSAPFI